MKHCVMADYDLVVKASKNIYERNIVKRENRDRVGTVGNGVVSVSVIPCRRAVAELSG